MSASVSDTGPTTGVIISERPDAEVPTLVAYNPTLSPVLLMEGETVTGGRQNRVLNVSVLIPAGATIDIPVSCVEQGRWNGGSEFGRVADDDRPAGDGCGHAALVGEVVDDAEAAAEMVEAILKDKKKVLPCAAFLQGEYGIKDLFVGVPCKLGSRGLEQIVQLNLTTDERSELLKSASAVKELTAALK